MRHRLQIGKAVRRQEAQPQVVVLAALEVARVRLALAHGSGASDDVTTGKAKTSNEKDELQKQRRPRRQSGAP